MFEECIPPNCQSDRSPVVVSSSFFSAPLPVEAIDVMLQNTKKVTDFYGYIILAPMRGAIGRISTNQTAFVHRNALFNAFYALVALPDVTPKWPNEMHTLMKRWSSGAYVNYTDPLIQDWETAYYGENYARLKQVKAKYDPEQVFHFPQCIKPN